MEILVISKNRIKLIMNKTRVIEPYLFILPAFIFIFLVMLYPLIQVFIYSFSKWEMLEVTFTGSFENYIKIFTDPIFWKVIKNNFIVLINIPIQILIGTIIASLLHETTKGWRFYQSAYFIPVVLPVVAVGIIWTYIFRISGPINSFLELIGLERFTRVWLGNVDWALPSTIGVMIWKDIGFVIIIFLASLLSAPPEIFEASKVDGANRWQVFYYIKLPILFPVINIYAVLGVIWAFTDVFGFIYVLTGGGPGYSSTVIEYHIFQEAFKNFNIGYASALSVVVFLIIMVLVVIYIKIRNIRERV